MNPPQFPEQGSGFLPGVAPQNAADESTASMMALLEPLRRRWWLPLAGAILGILGSLSFLHLSTPRYAAYLQLVPADQAGAAVNRNITGLASLAGINLPQSQGSQFAFALETLKSRDVADALAKDSALMHRMFPQDWDSASNSWRHQPGPLDGMKAFIKTVLSMPIEPRGPPDGAAVQRLVLKRLDIAEDRRTSIATVSLTDTDPALAQEILSRLYDETDRHLRGRMTTRTEAYIRYISEKLSQVSLAEHRTALAAALADQERVQMMASSGQPFAAAPLGDISVSDRPVWPNTLLILIVGLGVGAALGAGLAYAAAYALFRGRSVN